jgi:hypothetical protein
MSNLEPPKLTKESESSSDCITTNAIYDLPIEARLNALSALEEQTQFEPEFTAAKVKPFWIVNRYGVATRATLNWQH